MRYKYKILICLMVITILFAGCTWESPIQTELSAEGYPPFEENSVLSYIKWEYNNWHKDYENRENKAYWVDRNNLSSTAEEYLGMGFILAGSQIICEYSEYSAFLEVLEEKKNECIDIVGTYYEPVESVNTYKGNFDKAFFEYHNLLIVDYCAYGSPSLRSRIDEMTIESSTVIISLEVERLIAVTGSCPGNIYFIPVPKKCIAVDVTYIEYDDKWSWE